jgi:AraC-like DNA-binding protein
VTIETETAKIVLKAQRCYMIPAGIRFTAQTDRPLQQTFIHFDVAGLYGLVMQDLFGEVIALPADFVLGSMVEQIVRGRAAGERADLLTQAQVKAVLYAGLSTYLATLPPERRALLGQHAAGLEPLMPALRYVETHLAEGLTNRQLAELCYMSEGHFIRRFHAVIGQTPVQYLLDRRVQQAARLLRLTDWSIDRIAGECGFGSRFYFHRVFTRLTGLSPSAYRKAPEITA